MRIFNKYRGTRGFVVAAERGIRWRYMITKTAIRRTEILAFWAKHGLTAVIDAFEIKRRTLFNWKRKLKAGGGKLDALTHLEASLPSVKIKVNAENNFCQPRVLPCL